VTDGPADWLEALAVSSELARNYLRGVPTRPVAPPVDPDELRARLAAPLQDDPIDPGTVLRELATGADEGLVASVGPRYFGYVVGGVLPAALGADWLTSAWDQMAGSYVGSPAAAVIEETVADWLLELLELPAGTTVGLTTGSQMGNFTALAAARQRMLGDLGWNVERRGLRDAPQLRIVTGEERHVTVDVALRYLGIGSDDVTLVPCDANGAILAEALAATLRQQDLPTIVVAQAGNVNTGAFDPIGVIAETCREHGAWLHVDGAFGLWARVVPGRRRLLAGMERASSWVTDGHKWLNVPYDSGIVFIADGEAHTTVMRKAAAYAMSGGEGERDNETYVPEFSRRARAIPIYAALRSLGRSGLAELIDRSCRLARRLAERVAEHPRVTVLNEVALNQVLLRFAAEDEEALLASVLDRVHRGGTFWAGRSTWRGQPTMRISISGWNTTEHDIDLAADALLTALDGSLR
jgi:glutamate/tyrosine decarboxylase-like PLP-dependent enzyme